MRWRYKRNIHDLNNYEPMSLRLDPKYHGVRVAAVRPKDSALSEVRLGFDDGKQYAELRVNATDTLYFRRSKLYDWSPRVIFASVGDRKYTRHDYKQALEALGLR